MLSDPELDGVVIASSNLSHRPIVEQATAAGKAVFVDKPLATTVEDARACVEAAEAAGVILQVGHQRRRTAADREINRMIRAGEIGEIQTVEAAHSVPAGFRLPETAWRWTPDESPLGSMCSLGVHKIDSMQYHAGPIRRVFCMTRPGRAVSIDEATILGFEFESGALGTMLTSFFTPFVSDLSVHGSDVSAFNLSDGARLAVVRRGERERTEIDLAPVDPVVDQLVEFALAMRGEATVETDGRVGLGVVAVMAAAVESAATGRAVDVEDVT
jgi:1,5-anhydro-D-fructose reductase (1,5-anhydro-D-mannitol-forming)